MGKSKEANDEGDPSWLDKDNDEKHSESLPLFGDGSIDLTDPPLTNNKSPAEDQQQQEQQQQKQKQKQRAENAVGDANNKFPWTRKTNKKKPQAYGSITSGSIAEEKMEEGAEVLLDRDEAKYIKSKLVDPQTLKPHTPGHNPCLWMFHLLEGVTTVVCCCLLVSQVFPFFIMRLRDIGFLVTLLKVYISLFCLLFVLTETGAPVPLLRGSALLQPYLSRGFLYSFLGLICVEEAYSERVKDMMSNSNRDEFHISWAPLFMQVTAWLVLSCGVIYMLLGICCLKRLRDRMQQNEIDAWRKYRENLREWQQRFG